MVTLAPRYDREQDGNGQWSIIDHMPGGKPPYQAKGEVIGSQLTEEQSLERLHQLWDADGPRLDRQLQEIYRAAGYFD